MDVNELKNNARKIIEENRAECDYILYKRSCSQKDKILKTICAYANNYMNRDYGYLFIGIKKQIIVENRTKVVPVRPISGLNESELETMENQIKELLKFIQPIPTCHFFCDQIDGRWYLVVVVEPNFLLPEVTSEGARATGLRQGGHYIRINRDTILPDDMQRFELYRRVMNNKPVDIESIIRR